MKIRYLIFSFIILSAVFITAVKAEAEECIGEHHTIEVNGVSLYYEVAGEGKPVILVHGNGSRHQALRTEICQLSDAGYQVYAIDSRGQGNNEPLEEYHYADMAEDVYQFMKELKLEKPAFYGSSDGGIVGLTLAIAHPDSLCLLAASGANINPYGLTEETMEDFKREAKTTKSPLVKMMLEEPNIKPADLRTITIPVLITAGSDDVIVPGHTEVIADSIPNAELKIFEGETHSSYISNSEKMGDLLIEFMEKNDY